MILLPPRPTRTDTLCPSTRPFRSLPGQGPRRPIRVCAQSVTEPLKVGLVQDILAPYRIKLFEKIARTPGIDFRLIMLSHGVRAKPQDRTSPRLNSSH